MRRLELTAFTVDQRHREQLSSCALARHQRCLLGCDRERLVPAAEHEQLDQDAGAHVRFPAAVAAAAGERYRLLRGLERVSVAVGRLEHDAEVVLRPERACIQLLCMRACDGGLEQDPRLGEPSQGQEHDRFAGERLDEDFW